MMLDPLLLLAGGTLALGLAVAVGLARGVRQLPRLRDVPPTDGPRVSVVIAARNEADQVAATIHALLAQEYPVEVVVVDDRSTDGTGAILDGLAERHGAVRVLHVDTLPDGWLGKCHALQRGAELAEGELLIFTDADVIMAPTAVARGVALMQREGVDHVAVAPRILAGSAPATMTVVVFLTLFAAVFRPWKARDPESRRHIGIGAFNLVRTDAYHAIGGHRSVRLRPDDDVRLGRALKAAGYRQAAGLASDLISVEWYPTLRAMARGLRKNAFAVVDYRLWPVAAGTLIPLVLVFWPVTALFATTGLVWWLNAGVVALGVGTAMDTARAHGLPLWTGPAYPLGALFLLWIIWAAALRAVCTGTVEWRGTEYELDELRS